MTKRDLNQRTAEVLARVTETGGPRYESGDVDALDADFASSRLLRSEVIRVLRRYGCEGA